MARRPSGSPRPSPEFAHRLGAFLSSVGADRGLAPRGGGQTTAAQWVGLRFRSLPLAPRQSVGRAPPPMTRPLWTGP